MKRAVSVLLAVCLMVGALWTGIVPASATNTMGNYLPIAPDGIDTLPPFQANGVRQSIIQDQEDVDEVLQAIADYNLNHGGTGALVGTVTGEDEITITGEVHNVTQPLIFPNRVIADIKLSAIMEADELNPPPCLIDLTMFYEVEVVGGNLRTSGTAIDGAYPATVSSGSVKGNISCYHIFVSGGSVTGNLEGSYIEITGGIVSGTLTAGYAIELSGGVIYADGIDASNHLKFSGNAKVNQNSPFDINVPTIIYETTATLNFTLTNYIEINDNAWRTTVYGNAIINGGVFSTGSYTFTIPSGTSLTLINDAELQVNNFGKLAINGSLVIQKGKLTIETFGTVSGKNAGQFAKWRQRLPRSLLFFLCFFCLGFLWMN